MIKKIPFIKLLEYIMYNKWTYKGFSLIWFLLAFFKKDLPTTIFSILYILLFWAFEVNIKLNNNNNIPIILNLINIKENEFLTKNEIQSLTRMGMLITLFLNYRYSSYYLPLIFILIGKSLYY